MEGQDVVTSDDHKIGPIVGERDGFAIVEMGHVFKSKHALPLDFLHEFEGVQRATVDKELVAGSPKLDGDELDVNAVRMHYGLVDITTDSPAEQLDAADTPAWTTAGLGDRDDAVDRDRHLGDPG